MASIEEVEKFLADFKVKLSIWGVAFRNDRKKNIHCVIPLNNYCMRSPNTGAEMELKKEVTTLDFRKESFQITFHFMVCKDTGEQFTSSELDTVNLNQVYNKYREKYGIPFTEEIINIRLKYGLSASKMTQVLGLGGFVIKLSSEALYRKTTGVFITM